MILQSLGQALHSLAISSEVILICNFGCSSSLGLFSAEYGKLGLEPAVSTVEPGTLEELICVAPGTFPEPVDRPKYESPEDEN